MYCSVSSNFQFKISIKGLDQLTSSKEPVTPRKSNLPTVFCRALRTTQFNEIMVEHRNQKDGFNVGSHIVTGVRRKEREEILKA